MGNVFLNNIREIKKHMYWSLDLASSYYDVMLLCSKKPKYICFDYMPNVNKSFSPRRGHL